MPREPGEAARPTSTCHEAVAQHEEGALGAAYRPEGGHSLGRCCRRRCRALGLWPVLLTEMTLERSRSSCGHSRRHFFHHDLRWGPASRGCWLALKLLRALSAHAALGPSGSERHLRAVKLLSEGGQPTAPVARRVGRGDACGMGGARFGSRRAATFCSRARFSHEPPEIAPSNTARRPQCKKKKEKWRGAANTFVFI